MLVPECQDRPELLDLGYGSSEDIAKCFDGLWRFNRYLGGLTGLLAQLRRYLSSYVPDLLAAKVESFIDNVLTRNSLSREAIRFWGIHPGGSKILDYLQDRLGLSEGQMEHSRAVLRNYGNMSSATILFVQEHIQQCGHPVRGDYGVLIAFDPGLTMEALLVRWT